MKRISLFLGLLFVIVISANAQLEIKAMAGLNVSGMPGNDFESSNQSAGYQFGGALLMGNKFYIEPGFQFGKMTSTVKGQDALGDLDEHDFKQNFFRIPVYAGYHLLGAEDQPVALRIFAGPAVTIPGKLDKEFGAFKKDNMNKSLWGIDGGLGLDIFFLFVEANYEYSFTDRFVDGIKGKHSSIYINAGVHIDL